MSNIYLLVIVFVLVGMSRDMDAAPVEWNSMEDDNQYQQSEIERMLRNAMFNSTNNFYTIKKVFQPQQGIHKICIPIEFNISCIVDQPVFDDICSNGVNNGTLGDYHRVLWTEFDASNDIAGKVLLFFALSNLNVFGFDWAEACQNSPYDIIPTINLIVPSFLCCNDTHIELEIHQSLLNLTKLMPHYATLSSSTVPSIYDDISTGYAVDAEVLDGIHYHWRAVYLGLFAFVSTSIVLGLSTPLFVTIVESIETTYKGKPKLYYHFWSSVLLIIIGIWVYEVGYMYLQQHKSLEFSVVFSVMIVSSVIGMLTALFSAAREDNKIQLFSAPLSEYCGDKCMAVWSWLMTLIGFSILLSFIVYLLYAIPTIVFVYYLYPTRTLIRVPFIIGALFYTITLMSLVFYLFEKVSALIVEFIRSKGGCTLCLTCEVCCNILCCNILCRNVNCDDSDEDSDEDNDNDDHNEEEGDELRPLNDSLTADYGINEGLPDQPPDEYPFQHDYADDHINDPPYGQRIRKSSYAAIPCIRPCIKQCRRSIRHIIQQRRYNRAYFNNKLNEDLKVIRSQCHLIISIIQLLAVVIILAVYICAELILAKLVFRQTSATNINTCSLLALLPTVIFSLFTWFGRGLIFDVREDIKELSIPCFKKKETTEEKMLQELTAVKKVLLHGSRVKQVSDSTEAALPTGRVNEAVEVKGIAHKLPVNENKKVKLVEVPNEESAGQNIITETPKLALADTVTAL